MTGLGMFGLGIRKGRAAVWVAMTLVVGVVTTLASTSFVHAQLGLRPVPPTKEFFRIKARYVVKATGEVIQFDVVRPCRAVTARDMYGDRVWVPPLPIEWGSYFYTVNPIFPKVTGDHRLIIMFIPNGCYERNGVPIRTANGLAPKDLLPAVIWYDDPDEPVFGWEYATEDAYSSPFAKLSFQGATIEDATADDFIEWQKNAAVGFRPSKVVMHPFGFTFAQEQGFEDEARTKRTAPIALNCQGVARFKLLGVTKDIATQAWPSNHPHFWTLKASEDDGKKQVADQLFDHVFGRASLSTLFEDGFLEKQYTSQGNRASPTRASSGYERNDIHPMIVFPLVRSPYGRPFVKENAAMSDLFYELDVGQQMKGFLACYMGTPGGVEAIMPDWRDKHLSWRVSGEPVAGQPVLLNRGPAQPSRFFEDDQYVYEYVHQ